MTILIVCCTLLALECLIIWGYERRITQLREIQSYVLEQQFQARIKAEQEAEQLRLAISPALRGIQQRASSADLPVGTEPKAAQVGPSIPSRPQPWRMQKAQRERAHNTVQQSRDALAAAITKSATSQSEKPKETV